ncbi:MAG: DNA topoisomerase I [Candidatus Aenigmarchaeota archaeon]|nr:DNA topoisomerase I [Candidatus Aenigmarchaeota archaeon]
MSNFVLLIAEKPQAALKIAQALSEGEISKKSNNNVYWFEFYRNGKKHVCVPTVGHLFVLDAKEKKWSYPVFEMEWVPAFKRKESAFSLPYYKNLKMFENAEEIVVCCDYDTEGEVIGYNILRFVFGREDAKRMKFSTLTKPDLIEAYENMMEHIDFGQAEAGLTRHYLDFLWGINTTRALTISMRSVKGGFAIVSTGRVQGPTLHLLAKREKEIASFVPTPYWELESHVLAKKEIVAVYEKGKIFAKQEAERIYEECKGKEAVVADVKSKETKLSPPVPFDTTALQTEAYRCFGFSPAQTLSIAESLYTAGYISYPRTSSQKLPEKIGYKSILLALKKINMFEKDAEELLKKSVLKPKEGTKEDPAHPAIYPTTQPPNIESLNPQEKKLYELIVRRFFAVFGDNALRKVVKIAFDINSHKFIATGYTTIGLGWLKYYPFVEAKEIELPEVKKGEVFAQKIFLLEKETKPPERYTQASILKEMEKNNLGTKATRAQILQTLYDRGYIKGKSIKVTSFGLAVTEALEKYCPQIIDVGLTAKFEEEMEMIRERKKEMQDVIKEAKDVLSSILEEFRENESKIGEFLAEKYKSTIKEMNFVGKCPKCDNDLLIIKSKSSGKRFVGCSNYKNGCDFSSPLPQKGNIHFTEKLCKKCSSPIVIIKTKGKRPFSFCLNVNCKKD